MERDKIEPRSKGPNGLCSLTLQIYSFCTLASSILSFLLSFCQTQVAQLSFFIQSIESRSLVLQIQTFSFQCEKLLVYYLHIVWGQTFYDIKSSIRNCKTCIQFPSRVYLQIILVGCHGNECGTIVLITLMISAGQNANPFSFRCSGSPCSSF